MEVHEYSAGDFEHVVLASAECGEGEVYRWVAKPNRPYQRVGNVYKIVALTEETYDRYIRPISSVDRSLEEYLRLWDERPDLVEGAKPTHVLLSRTEQESEMRAFRVGTLDYLRGYMEARERAGWFERASYGFAIAWAAENDSAVDGDSLDPVAASELITARLVADLFDVPTEKVGRDIVRYREKHGI